MGMPEKAKNWISAEISGIPIFLKTPQKKRNYQMAVILSKLLYIPLKSNLIQYWIKKWSLKPFAKKTQGRGGGISKKRDFCCFFGFFVIFGARHSLSGVARARIIFFGHSHDIQENIFKFWCPYEQKLEPPNFDPSEISAVLKSTTQKKFRSNQFYHFSSGFNYGTSTKIINYRKKVPPPPFESGPNVWRIYLWDEKIISFWLSNESYNIRTHIVFSHRKQFCYFFGIEHQN